MKNTKFDNKGRGIANVRLITGDDSVQNSTHIRNVIFLKRDNDDKMLSKELSIDEAMEYLTKNDFCNPHQMIRDERKTELRNEFFRRYLSKCTIHMVNTTESATNTQKLIRKIIGLS